MIDNNRSLDAAAAMKPGIRETANPLPEVAMLVLAFVVNLMVLAKVDLPVIRPVLGFWFVIVLPAYLLFTASVWRNCGFQERMAYSICSPLLVLMLAGLVVNEVMPLVGFQHPLDPRPVVILSDLINISFYIFRSRNPAKVRLYRDFARIGRQEFRLLVAASLTVVLAIFGANRLNNGAGDNVALIALAMMALVGVFSIRWLRFAHESVISVVIYLVSLALLLTTSLRGWYITGHDIQQEYLVFQLTETHAHWSMAYFRDPYNACLSITILPTELAQVIHVDSPYVFKLFYQLIFALCPVFMYSIARRYFNRGISVLSVAYFLSFPTFYTDIPFLNRQEIALLFIAAGLLAATNPAWSIRRRQIYLGVAGLGTEISHYSTMYVLVGTIVFALLLSYASRLFIKPKPVEALPTRPSGQLGRTGWIPTPARGAITVGLLAVFVGIIIAWGTLATRTTTQVLSDSKAIESAGLSFSILPGGSDSTGTALQNLRKESLEARAAAPPGTYLPWSVASKAAAPVLEEQLTPLTPIGRELASVGVPVASLNSAVHSLEADGEELFLAVGLIALFIRGRRAGRITGGQFYWLAAGCTTMIVLITVFPSISADYGVLRAFQQGLLFFAPMVVVGSMTVFAPLGKSRSRIAGCIVCLGVFLTASSLVPQLLGNNEAQLNLNNSGLYYDLYYKTPQDVSALVWLEEQPDVLHYPIQASWDTRRFLITGPNGVGDSGVLDEYPTLVTRAGWVILDQWTTSSGTAYSYDVPTGDLIEYKYPVGLLQKYKNLVYTDGGAIIYK